jgi:hypothetical protein
VPKTCADGNNCTVDACDPLTGSCVAPPVTCHAGQSCNPANGECGGSDPCAGVVCQRPRGACAVNSCVAGACVFAVLPAGTPCSSNGVPGICNGLRTECPNGYGYYY